MTFDDYIKNPMGKNNMLFSGLEMYRKMYNDKLSKILLREAGKINYKLYKDGNSYYIHMKIPSEVVPKFYYDTVVRFHTINVLLYADKNLRKYDVEFYSNDPSFVYTFAHAFIKNNMFIDILKSKMSKLSVKKVAKERNPQDQVGYVKSIFFMYIIMNTRGLFEKVMFDTYGSKFNKNILLNDIMDADIKVEQRQEAADKLRKENKSERIKQQRVSTPPKESKNAIKPKPSVKTVSTTKTVNRIKTVKRK